MRVVSTCLIATLLAAGLAAPAQAATTPDVTFDIGLSAGASPDAIAADLAGYLAGSREIWGLDAMSLDVPPGLADYVESRLHDDPDVAWIERGAFVTADYEMPNTGLGMMQVPEAWTWTSGSSDVTVAVVDSGVTSTVDLPAARMAPGWDFVDGDDAATDADGHGTTIAGVIAAEPGNNAGTAGVCGKCTIMPVRVLHGGQGSSGVVASGIAWAAAHGADVINLSLSTPVESRALREAVHYAAALGVVVVASAGNVASTAQRYPAAFDSVLSVGEHAMKNRGAWVDVTAYSNYLALGPDGAFAEAAGASGATAAAAGVAALALSLRPATSPADVVAAITRDADPTSGQAPLINAARLASEFSGDDSVPPVVTRSGLTEGELVPARGEWLTPVATDDHAVERIDLLVDGKVLATLPRFGNLTVLRPPAGRNGPMPVTVRAYDYAGNYGETTTVVRADTTFPTATWISPAANAVVHGTSVDVTVAGTSTDIVRISGLQRVAGTNTWKGRVALRSDGDLRIGVEDEAGNETELSRQLRVDNLPPAGGSIAPAQNKRVRGTFTTTLTGVTDLGGVAKAELWANGRWVGDDKTAPYALSVKTGSTNGPVTLRWKVIDKFGQYRSLPVRTVIADNAGPAVAITAAPKPKAKVKGTVKVYVKATDPSGVARVELLVNGKVVARDWTAGYVVSVNTKKQKKTMKVQVRAYDKLGNVKYTASRTWTRA